jgi:hypothetical protein
VEQNASFLEESKNFIGMSQKVGNLYCAGKRKKIIFHRAFHSNMDQEFLELIYKWEVC